MSEWGAVLFVLMNCVESRLLELMLTKKKYWRERILSDNVLKVNYGFRYCELGGYSSEDMTAS